MNSNIQNYLLLVIVCIISLVIKSGHAKKEKSCEVCENVIQRFIDEISDDIKASPQAIEEEFINFCTKLRGKDERFCYYIGGHKTSATYILGTMSKPISWSMPADKVCKKLHAADSQICDLKYDKTIDLATVDFKKLKVKELKKILSDWGEDNACKGCAEKSEFIEAVKKLMPKYAPDAVKKREEL